MKPAWTMTDFLEVKENVLRIDQISAAELARNHQTPLFVFSENRIRSNITRLVNIATVIDCKLKVCYAAKANSNLAILKVIQDAGSDIEVNSGGELYIALKVGFRPDQIIFNGTSKTENELAEAIDAGIYAIQADSVFELELIEKIAGKLEKRANVSLRLVPEIESDTLHGLQTALLTSKFGMMPAEALDAFRRWRPDDRLLNLCGIHLHIGSQNPKPEPYERAFVALFENLLRIHQVTGHQLRHLNIGGGFPVNYLRDDSNSSEIADEQRALFSANLDPAEIIRNAWQAVKKSAATTDSLDLIKDIELLIEPGRSVIGDAGICLTTVRNKKTRPIDQNSRGIERVRGQTAGRVGPETGKTHRSSARDKDTWLLTDAGFNSLLSMETYKWYYHLVAAERADEPHQTPYKVAGPLCDGGDVYFDIEGKKRLPDYRDLPENIEVNDLLAILNCGAYSLSQMFPYNGRQLPAAVLIDKKKAVKLIRTRQTYEDLLSNQIFPID